MLTLFQMSKILNKMGYPVSPSMSIEDQLRIVDSILPIYPENIKKQHKKEVSITYSINGKIVYIN